MSKKPTMLLIMDGFGYSEETEGNGVAAAKKPNFDRLWYQYCHGYLDASGLEVGLPAGQIGNSEVGHMNMGAGRVVYQDLTRITKYINDGVFYENPVLNEAMDLAVNGMIPDNTIGRKAMTRLRVYAESNHAHEAQKPEEFKL